MIDVHAIWLAQDDPKKNTAVRSAKRGDLRLHRSIRSVPKRGVLLEPLCGKVLGPEDHHIVLDHGIVALDCSWNRIEETVEALGRRTKLTRRMLPVLLATNPVNWGNPGSSAPSKRSAQRASSSVMRIGPHNFSDVYAGARGSLN